MVDSATFQRVTPTPTLKHANEAAQSETHLNASFSQLCLASLSTVPLVGLGTEECDSMCVESVETIVVLRSVGTIDIHH